MRKSKMMISARQDIEFGVQSYICLALCKHPPQRKLKELRQWIKDLLHPYGSYTHWLRAEHPDFYYNHVLVYGEDTRTGRLQWLDWMIKTLQEEEAGI